MNEHPRAEFWSMFAAAALSRPTMDSTGAAKIADTLLDEFDKRWEWYEGGYGCFWKQKDTKKKK